ncbi:MAG: LacI family transcriptional regulator [Lachnospiraceae bacterium]|nr:LacI family transcriptional regulator [Lachnospiraceae bacterium]
MVTLKDIAREAGVSVMTVSRVVNQRYQEVSDKNIAKIQEIIDKYGYVPNSSARSLSSKSSHIISVIVQEGRVNPMLFPFNASMVGYIVQGIQSHGYQAMVHFIRDYSDVTRYLRSWKSEGAVFLGTFDENIKQIQKDNDIPLIFTDSYSSVRQVINVGLDDYKGGVLAARHFIEYGHREFAFLCSCIQESQVNQQRLAGFADTLEAAGFSLPESHIFDTLDLRQGAEDLCALADPVTAVFVPIDESAAFVMTYLKEKGHRIPEDYSIIGFDDFPLCQYVDPPLTTIAQDVCQKAQYALDLLFQRLRDNTLPTQNIVLDVELISRKSVARVNL